ncbi:MAG: hydantoinase B/oxoprolinase family protein, partial [Thermomicrobiales bacterium]
RGGFGTIREYRVTSPGGASLLASLGRSATAPWGIAGGLDGTINYWEVVRVNGERRKGGRVTGLELQPGDLVRLVTGNGGGWGNPAERPVADLRDDLLDGYLTPADLEAHYARSAADVLAAEDAR